MTMSEFAEKMRSIGCDYDGQYVRAWLMKDRVKLEKTCDRLNVKIAKVEDNDIYLKCWVDKSQFKQDIVASAMNQTTGIIKSRCYRDFPKKDALWNLVNSVRESPFDKILVEIDPNVEDFDNHVPFKS